MPTLEDIARAAGVATITASRVLNGRVQYRRPAGVRRASEIRRLAAEMGYRPNSAAQSMRSGRHGTVALLLSTVHSRSLIPPAMLDGILAALMRHNLHLTLSPVPDEQLVDPDYTPKMLRTWACDGLLVNYNAAIPARLEELVARAAMPTVWINSKHAANCVYPDDFGAARTLTERLLAAGHRRIAYANYMAPNHVPTMHYSGIDRYEGYATAMRAAGLAPRRLDCDRVLEHDERIPHSLGWLRGPAAPTAVVCYCARTADPVACAIRQHGRRSAPCLCAFGDAPPYVESYEWHTVRIPMHAMGAAATELLLGVIANPALRRPPIVQPLIQPSESALLSPKPVTGGGSTSAAPRAKRAPDPGARTPTTRSTTPEGAK